MIPYKDDIRTRTFPIITSSLIFVNILVFLGQQLLLRPSDAEALYRSYGLIPREFLAAVAARWDLIPYNALTVFTSMFLHGGYLHILGNMLYLWVFGCSVEDAMGRGRFLVFYFMGGVAAAAFQFLCDPASTIPMIGASGAVAGLLGAYLVLYPFARVKTVLFIIIFVKIVELPAVLLLTVWFLMQVLFSYGEGVAWFAHIGGFIFSLCGVKLFMLGRRTRK
jgi:membrane associated rhomboid family serine protease